MDITNEDGNIVMNEGLRPTVELIQETAVKASRADIADIAALPRHTHLIRRPDGRVEHMEAPRPLRKIQVQSLGELVRMAAIPFDSTVEADKRSALFYGVEDDGQEGRDGPRTNGDLVVHLVLDHQRPEDVAVFRAKPTLEYLLLDQCDVDGGVMFTPKSMVQHFRTTMRSTMSPEQREALVKQVGTLNTRTSVDVQSGSSRGKDTFGALADNDTVSTDLPDEDQVFNLLAWRCGELTERNPVSAVLDPEASETKWRLRTVEESFEVFKRNQIAQVRDVIDRTLKANGDVAVPVFEGLWIN